jgi:hypothetical protein
LLTAVRWHLRGNAAIPDHQRKLIAREDGHPMARDGPEATAVRVGQRYRMEKMLRCLDLGTIAAEEPCSEGGHSSGRLSEAS